MTAVPTTARAAVVAAEVGLKKNSKFKSRKGLQNCFGLVTLFCALNRYFYAILKNTYFYAKTNQKKARHLRWVWLNCHREVQRFFS
jgi:hypothetical protein